MLKIRFRKISTPFLHPFTTSHETKTVQHALHVAIEYNGLRGIGEAPAISYYDMSTEKMTRDLQAKAQMIEQYAFTEPARFWHFCHHIFPDNPFLVCALDLAYWDLYAQFKKKSIAELLNIERPTTIDTFYTLAMDTAPNMLAKMNAQAWPQYKVKITDQESIDNLQILASKTNSAFAVDANAAWTLEQARVFVPHLEALQVLFIEQPLAKNNLADMTVLQKEFEMPFFADESFQDAADIEKCAAAFDGINIKLTKCSGLSPAIKIIEQAKEKNLKTMLGCMNETEIGIFPAAQIGALVDYRDLDGPLLLDTTCSKLRYADGYIIFNQL